MSYYEGHQWRVTEDGIEARDGGYYIRAEDLQMEMGRGGWIEHMADKGDVDVEDFIRAYQVALRVHTEPKGQT